MSKDTYKGYPDDMTLWKAVGRFGKRYASDVVMGIEVLEVAPDNRSTVPLQQARREQLPPPDAADPLLIGATVETKDGPVRIRGGVDRAPQHPAGSRESGVAPRLGHLTPEPEIDVEAPYPTGLREQIAADLDGVIQETVESLNDPADIFAEGDRPDLAPKLREEAAAEPEPGDPDRTRKEFEAAAKNQRPHRAERAAKAEAKAAKQKPAEEKEPDPLIEPKPAVPSAFDF
jgi:hypothetical protein